MPTKKKFYCYRCGTELNNSNCRKANNSVSGYSYLCISCEENRLSELAELQGIYEALYSQCSALDIPLVPRVLDGVDLTTLESPWKAYLRLLKDNGEYLVDGELRGFKDGIQSIFGVFGNNLTHKDFTARIKQDVAKIQAERKRKKDEEERLAKLPGTEEQRERWGNQPPYKGMVLTQGLYDELDRLYEIRANSYKGQTITPQMDDTLIKVAKSNVIYDHLMRQGLVKAALDVQKNIDLLLASEQMRKKDEKPVEHYRVDSQIVALENAGCMEDGKLLSIDKLQQALFDRFFANSEKYPHTLDVVDEMIERIWNTLRENAHEPISMDLPSGLQVVDTNGEMQAEKSEEEQQNERDASVTRVSFVDENGKQVGRTKKQNKKNEP